MIHPALRLPFALFLMTSISLLCMIQHLRAKQSLPISIAEMHVTTITATTQTTNNSSSSSSLIYPILTTYDQKFLKSNKNILNSKNSNIPIFFLHQMWRSPCIPLQQAKISLEWRSIDYTLYQIFWTDHARNKWIENKFSADSKMINVWNTLKSYDHIRNIFFRYVIIWIFGGISSDASIKPLRALRGIFEDNNEIILIEDLDVLMDLTGQKKQTQTPIDNGLFGASSPNHPFFYLLVNNFCDDILLRVKNCIQLQRDCTLTDFDVSRILTETYHNYVSQNFDHRTFVIGKNELKSDTCQECWINHVHPNESPLPCLRISDLVQTRLITIPED